MAQDFNDVVGLVSNLLKEAGGKFTNRAAIKNLGTNSEDPWRSNRPARIMNPRKKVDSGRENATKALKKRLLK